MFSVTCSLQLTGSAEGHDHRHIVTPVHRVTSSLLFLTFECGGWRLNTHHVLRLTLMHMWVCLFPLRHDRRHLLFMFKGYLNKHWFGFIYFLWIPLIPPFFTCLQLKFLWEQLRRVRVEAEGANYAPDHAAATKLFLWHDNLWDFSFLLRPPEGPQGV